ncbi:hypothetical protein CDD80_2786 [Ophiocordyceps camponoti-rufipedis]|uniref:Uncharacterized protein n=1 Tax=Ophiocordyceps camponoti-rufipedis TaxID=2004952 RepID=A0A2C5XJQ1_9HYPO|nr:hypothetical protein CDD80_2786 [Ophiocordyceps camponoti-rufipedis]
MAEVDVESVRRACMADLGRSRLDQLPLSDREVNGPSFKPKRDGLALKFAPKVRDALKSKWNIAIQDEESEQMEGLYMDDARPWAAKAAHIPTKVVPERPQKATKAPKAPTKPAVNHPLIATASGTSQPVKKPVKPVKARASKGQAAKAKQAKPQQAKAQQAKAQQAKAQQAKPQQAKPQQAKPQQAKAQPQQVKPPQPPPKKPAAPQHQKPQQPQQPQQPRPSAAPAASQQPQQPHSSAASAVDVLCIGTCFQTIAGGATEISVRFSMFINVETDSAFLAVTLPGGERRVHNVLDMDAPVHRDNKCIVTAKSGRPAFHYCLRLQDDDQTATFARYLNNLRVAAHQDQQQDLQQDLPQDQPGSPLVEFSEDQAVGQDTAGTSQDLGQEQRNPSTKPSALDDLLGLEITLPAPGHVKDDCESATTAVGPADQLGEFVQRVLAEFSGLGPETMDESIRDMDEAAVDLWLNRSCLDEPDDIKPDLLHFVRTLRRMERRFKGLPRQSIDRIMYTADQVESLKNMAAPCPPQLRETVLFSPAAPGKGDDTARTTSEAADVRLPSMSKCRDWLLSSREKAEGVDTSEPMEIDTIPAPNLQATTVMGERPGLKASRWA